ncbi:MAG: PLP-dependent aspartate aminotransferase family protein [Pseudomonas sp.]|uniref:trans-sulfuration enzyme family protein n=1 Tax=Pseudomonas sp. TaxID=306 RepID=UPI002728EFEC|nr:PLP-dependent aspartate aminotransferase family protein [Pseudomonas sp.]MDO9618725.1 PLP-dependent aspartate aminotransferase family protein [Pseudomonas sp.]MDP2445890.1 PLP-dependent aspartate aminotransferase family protein [Pseudomonas sp.]MDZ4333614.1 PLP-dependent aspartate aminotransferase family protein [Pseudomonas sp.]
MSEHASGVSTRAVHSGNDIDQHMVTRAKSLPIYETSVFVYDSLAQVDDFLAGNPDNYMYTRLGNPNTAALEALIRDLEGGEAALFSASGMASISAALFGLLSAGDHLIASRELYGTTQSLIEKELSRFGISATLVDINDLAAVTAAITPATRLIYTETASNPLVRVSDIPALSKLAKAHGLKLLVDNTFLSPALYHPLADGADLVLHSTTKYLNGHSDATGGILVGDAQWIAQARRFQINAGGSASPFEAWLTFRGAKTLSLRMRAHSSNAQILAEALEAHPQVAKVYYPGLPSHPDHKLAQQLFRKGHSGMLSFTLKGGLAEVDKLIHELHYTAFAPSLAGVASSITHPGKTSHRALSAETLSSLDIHDGTIRVSVGIEDAEDIVLDFLQALDRL